MKGLMGFQSQKQQTSFQPAASAPQQQPPKLNSAKPTTFIQQIGPQQLVKTSNQSLGHPQGSLHSKLPPQHHNWQHGLGGTNLVKSFKLFNNNSIQQANPKSLQSQDMKIKNSRGNQPVPYQGFSKNPVTGGYTSVTSMNSQQQVLNEGQGTDSKRNNQGLLNSQTSKTSYMLFDKKGSRMLPSNNGGQHNQSYSQLSSTDPQKTQKFQMSPQKDTNWQARPSVQQQQENNSSSSFSNIGSNNNLTTGEEEIVIHVFDENRKINKDFKCQKGLLLTHMKYFEQYLKDAQSLDDIDISVHCDVKIFEWLMKYLKDKEGPKLDLKNVISILISSDFLGMAFLVNECVRFVKDNINDVVRLPIDMNCLNSKLIKKISEAVTIEELVSLRDRKDKLMSKVYMKKLENLTESEQNTLYRCVYCNQLFTSEQREWNVCPDAKIFIDFHGSVIAQHVADRYWDTNKFIQYMRKEGVPWKEVYWKVWACLQTFQCQTCNCKFIGTDLNHCSFHPKEAKFQFGSNTGVFQCCNQKTLRFDTSLKKEGCKAANHVPKMKSDAQEQKDQMAKFELLVQQQGIACEPFIAKVPSTGSDEAKKQEAELKDSTEQPLASEQQTSVSQSLAKLLEKYKDVYKNQKFTNQQRKLYELEEDEDESMSEGDPDKMNTSAQNLNTGANLVSRVKSSTNRGTSQPHYQQAVLKGGKKQPRAVRRDLLRKEDSNDMQDIINKMRKNRIDDKDMFKQGQPQPSKDKKGTSQSPVKQNSSNLRPLSEPAAGGINKKNINYRIKNNVIKR